MCGVHNRQTQTRQVQAGTAEQSRGTKSLAVGKGNKGNLAGLTLVRKYPRVDTSAFYK